MKKFLKNFPNFEDQSGRPTKILPLANCTNGQEFLEKSCLFLMNLNNFCSYLHAEVINKCLFQDFKFLSQIQEKVIFCLILKISIASFEKCKLLNENENRVWVADPSWWLPKQPDLWKITQLDTNISIRITVKCHQFCPLTLRFL